MQTRRWLWMERLLLGGGLVLLLVALAVLGLNSSRLPTRWAEEALARALPGVGVELGSVRLTGLRALEATALRVDLDGDGRPDVRADRVTLGFDLLRGLAAKDLLGAVERVTIWGVHARVEWPQAASPAPSPGRTGGLPSGPDRPSDPAAGLLARLPAGLLVQIREADLTLADGQGELVRLAGEATLTREDEADGRLAGSLVLVDQGGSRLAVELGIPVEAGAWSGTFQLAADLGAPWVSQVLARVEGWPRGIALTGPVTVAGTLSGSGPWPQVELAAEGGPVTIATPWATYPMEQLEARARWAGGPLILEALKLRDGPAALVADGQLDPKGLQLAVRGERLPLARYLPVLEGYVDGEGALEGHVDGPWGALRLDGVVTAPVAAVMGGEVDALEAEVAWDQGRLQIARAEVQAGPGRLTASGWWQPGEGGGQLAADVTSQGFPLQLLAPFRALGLAGRVDGQVRLEGPVGDPALTAQLASARLVAGPATFEEVAGTFGGTWSQVRIEALAGRRVGGGQYQVSGWVGPQVGDGGSPGAGLDVELYVVDESLPEMAALLGYQFPSYLLAGRFDGRARLEGSLAAPAGSARLELKDSPLLGEELVTQLDLRFGDGAVRVERVRRHPLRTGLDSWVPS